MEEKKTTELLLAPEQTSKGLSNS
jgi:hypothetical protein